MDGLKYGSVEDGCRDKRRVRQRIGWMDIWMDCCVVKRSRFSYVT